MTSNRNILRELTQKNSSDNNYHPNMADPLATAPTTSVSNFMMNLKSLGMSAAAELPKEFDWRDQHGIELTPVSNQHHCGNCWAISSTNSFADRYMVTSGKTGLLLDPLVTTVCVPGNRCGGGLPENCQQFFVSPGASIKDASCMSWDQYCASNDQCCPGCNENNSKEYPKISCNALQCKGGFKAATGMMKAGTVTNESGQVDPQQTIHNIKTDIRLHGPIVGKFYVFGDFMVGGGGLVVNNDSGAEFNWKNTNGVYLNGHYDSVLGKTFKRISKDTHSGDPTKLKILAEGLMPDTTSSGEIVGASPSKALKGAHAVEIIGWGVDKDYGDYWIVKNSWGPEWNGDGHFKFGMNTDGDRNAACGMDIPTVSPQGQLFGGTVSFIPDVDDSLTWPGMKKGGGIPGPGDESTGGPSSSTVKWVLIGLGIALVVGLAVYFGFFYKRNRSIHSRISQRHATVNRPARRSVRRSSATYTPRLQSYSPNM